MGKFPGALVCAVLALVAGPLLPGAARAELTTHAMDACKDLHTELEPVPVERRGHVVMSFVLFHEDQGREAPVPEYTVEAPLCLAEHFQVDGRDVLMTSAGFHKGLQTLHYRIVYEDKGKIRSILVLYSALVSAVYGDGQYFFVSETRGLATSFYEVYKAQPGHATLKALASQIVRGKANPLIAGEFRDDDWEFYITAYDEERLKRSCHPGKPDPRKGCM